MKLWVPEPSAKRTPFLGVDHLVLPFLAACGDDPAGLEGFGTVVIQFDNVVGTTPVAMNTATYTNAAGNQYTISKLEYTVSDFVLGGASATFDHDEVHYRDEGDAGTASLTIPDVPAGEYTSLDFLWGIAPATNTPGSHPDLDAAGMAWPAMMGGGYHYMRHEGAFTPTGGGTANFTTHLGPSMGNDYSFAVMLDLPSMIRLDGGDTAVIVVNMDVNEWYTGPNMYDFNDYGAIMGNTAAQAMLQANGASVWSAASVSVN